MSKYISVLIQIFFSTAFTCFAQEDFTPKWSKGIVWYQVFPDRFNNGDPKNDPRISDQNGAFPFNDTSAFQISARPMPCPEATSM